MDMSATTGGFSGVPEAAVLEYGKLVIAAGRLERQARDILLDLGHPPRKKQADEVLREIRRSVKDGLLALVAAHASSTPDELTRWSLSAAEAFRARNEIFHAVALQKKQSDGDLAPFTKHLRTGRATPLDVTAVTMLVTNFVDASAEGFRLHKGLLRSPRRGVYLRNAYMEEADYWFLCTEADIDRPTEAEADEWWVSLGPWWTQMDPWHIGGGPPPIP